MPVKRRQKSESDAKQLLRSARSTYVGVAVLVDLIFVLRWNLEPREEHLREAENLWCLSKEVKFLRRVENFVYTGVRDGEPVILRLTEPEHRTIEEIHSELDWMDYLAGRGLKVASPIRSEKGNFVEPIEVSGEVFSASLFRRVPGEPLTEKADFPLKNFFLWGEYLGRMHLLTQDYQPRKGVASRSLWNEDSGFQVNLAGLDENDPAPFERFHDLMSWLGTLSREKGEFGLVHCDLHYGNFFLHNGEIWAFDFDDSCYHWMAYDVAVPLFGILKKSQEGFFEFSFEVIKEQFLKGYSSSFHLDAIWFDRLELFIQFRVATLYHWIKARKKVGLVHPNQMGWCDEMLTWGEKELRKDLIWL